MARTLRCRLGGRMILDGVDIDLVAGGTCGLFGPNGAGKTTLLRVLAGAIMQASGEVRLAGDRIDGLPLFARARRGLGYLSQHSSVFSGLTTAGNIEAALEAAGVEKALRADRRDELLASFGLTQVARQVAGTLSGGERRRLELARLWATRPRVLLLDEPFTGLDPPAVFELRRQIAGLRDASVTVLLAEHRVEQALTICQRACILVGGRVATCGPAAEVMEHPEVRRVFFRPEAKMSRSVPWD